MKVTVVQPVTAKTTPPVAPAPADIEIATSPNTNPKLLRQIASGKHGELRRLVASNPNTPTDVLWMLAIDFPEAVLSNPIWDLLQVEQLDLVAKIPPASLTSLLQCDRVPRKFMDYAVTQQDYSLWLAVAYNPHTPGALLENLARKSRSQDRELIRAIAAHPSTPAHLLAEIIEIGSSVAQVVAENAATSIEILKQILHKYAQTNDRTFTTLVALHPRLTPQLAIDMHLAPNELAAKSLWQAKQNTTTAAQLIELVQTDWDVLLLAVARHPQTPTEMLDRLWGKIQALGAIEARDLQETNGQMDRLIYDSFAGNPNTSIQLRGELRKFLKW
jgi:hypothetical protein